jgi:hypothetical protein
VGDVMISGRSLATIAAAFFACLTCAPAGSGQVANAESQESDRVLSLVELFASVAATAYVWGYGCQIGDPERWKHVFDAIDDRYKRCVSADSALAQAVAHQYSADLRFADKKTLGSLAFEHWLARRAGQFEKEGAASACKDPGLKEFIETGKNAHRWFEGALLLGLGDDRRWVTAPCNRFFPQDDGK